MGASLAGRIYHELQHANRQTSCRAIGRLCVACIWLVSVGHFAPFSAGRTWATRWHQDRCGGPRNLFGDVETGGAA